MWAHLCAFAAAAAAGMEPQLSSVQEGSEGTSPPPMFSLGPRVSMSEPFRWPQWQQLVLPCAEVGPHQPRGALLDCSTKVGIDLHADMLLSECNWALKHVVPTGRSLSHQLSWSKDQARQYADAASTSPTSIPLSPSSYPPPKSDVIRCVSRSTSAAGEPDFIESSLAAEYRLCLPSRPACGAPTAFQQLDYVGALLLLLLR